MSLTTIIRQPEVGEVGVKASFFAAGDPVGTETRFYLSRAPVNSALVTLATVAELPAAPVPDKTKARLTVEPSGQFSFTPDVPGHYEVEAHDVTVVQALRTYNDAPYVPDTDNDFAGAPVLTLNTAEGLSRYGTADYRAVQAVERTVGSNPSTITLALRMHDTIELKLPDAVKLTPSKTKLAEIAAFDDQVRGIGDVLRAGVVRGNGPGVIFRGHLQQVLSEDLEFLRQEWNLHLAAASTWTVHNVADTTNTVPATTVTTLAECLTRLAALKVAYNAHRVSSTFHASPRSPDTINKFPAALANPTDLATGLAFARLFFQILVWGGSDSSELLQNDDFASISGHFIAGGVHQNPGDPHGNSTFDFSSTVVGLCAATNKLTALYNAHRIRTTMAAPHASADTANELLLVAHAGMTTAGFCAWANAWADCIERHTADLDASNTPFAVPKHQNTRPIKIGLRAGDIASAVSVIELCCVAEEIHALDGVGAIGAPAYPAHAAACWGFHNRPGPWPVVTRLAAHWRRLMQTSLPVAPPLYNTEPIGLLSLGWK